MVVDRDVQRLPASAAVAADVVAVDPLPGRPEAAERLRVDVEQLAWPLPLLAAHTARLLCRPRQPRQPVTAQHLPDRRRRMRTDPRQPHRTVSGLAPGDEDPLLEL